MVVALTQIDSGLHGRLPVEGRVSQERPRRAAAFEYSLRLHLDISSVRQVTGRVRLPAAGLLRRHVTAALRQLSHDNSDVRYHADPATENGASVIVAPPMFPAIATDDFHFGGEFGLIKSWFEAGAPVEFHLYQNGGHGFWLGNPDRTSNIWFNAFVHWLDVNRFLEPSR